MLLPPVDPKTESGEGRGDGRHGKGDRLERCIAPGFIIRRKQGQIHAHEQLVIALVENTVPVIQIRRHENHMHFGCRIGQRTAVDRPHDRIPLHILQIMGRPRPLRAVDRLRWILQVLLQVGTGSPVGGRHHDIQHDLPDPGVPARPAASYPPAAHPAPLLRNSYRPLVPTISGLSCNLRPRQASATAIRAARASSRLIR